MNDPAPPSLSGVRTANSRPVNQPNLVMGLLNARSVKTQDNTADKPSEISELITEENLDLLFLTETWLTGDLTDEVALSAMTPGGFSVVHLPRLSGRGGGVGVIHRTELKITQKHLPQSASSYECLQICFPLRHTTLTICIIYRPPGTCLRMFMTELSDLLEQITSSVHGEVLLVGDFNIHVDQANVNPATDFLRLLESWNLVQHVNIPTHRKGHILDLVISRSSDATVAIMGTDECVSSDHACVLFSMQVQKPVKTRKTIRIRKLKDINPATFAADIRCSSMNDASFSLDARTPCNHYHDVLTHLLSIHAPEKTITITTKPNAPWFNFEIRQARRLCRKLERQWRASHLHVHRELFTHQRNELTRIRRQAKRTYYQGKVNSAASPKELCQITDSLLNRKKAAAFPSAKNDIELAEKFNTFFSQKILKIRAKIPTTLPASSSGSDVTISSPLTNFRPTTIEEVTALIKKSPCKTCSLDPVPSWLIKKCSPELAPVLSHIINSSLSSGIFPTSMKHAVISPILKKQNLDRENMANYRPVSNLSYVSKLTERVVARRLDHHCVRNHIHCTFQSAYRTRHSTETALLRVQNDILQSVDSKGGAILVLLDLSAAFDTIDHQLLINLFQTNFGIEETPLAWLKSYLEDRTQCVKIREATSSKTPLRFGVPQGSVLGPRLFSLYTRPLSDVIKRHQIQHHSYADDTQLYIAIDPQSSSDIAPAVRKIENAVSAIKDWMDEHFLKLNEAKTEVLVVKQPTLSVYPLSIDICSCPITPSKQVRDLGVTFDSTLNAETHVRATCKTAFFHLRNIANIRRYLSAQATEALIHAHVMSRIDYCNSLLFGIPAHCIQRLQRVQNAAARVILQRRRSDPATPLLQTLQWLPVEQRIALKLLCIVFQCKHDTAPSYLSSLLSEYAPPRPLRSTHQLLLEAPRSRLIRYGHRSFEAGAPRLWNELPIELRQCDSEHDFKRKLKKHLHSQ